MFKRRTPLRREAHLEVKRSKHLVFRSPLEVGVEKVHTAVAGSTFSKSKYESRFAWQAQWILHLLKSEANMWVLWHVQKRWHAWGSAKMPFAWQAQCKRHVHQRCYKVLGLSSLVLQKVVWMWRAAGHFGVSACLTTHVMIAKLYFCWRACSVLMFRQALRLPNEFLAGLGRGDFLNF